MKKYLLLIGLLLINFICQASFNEGVIAYEKGDYKTALEAWKAVVEQKQTISDDFASQWNLSENVSGAQYGLGLLYWQGKGVVQDYHQAEKWLALAANNGHRDAQLKLAYLYLTGLTGRINAAKTHKGFEQSALQSNVDAQYNLGLLCFKGLGLSQDQVLAKKWLSFAAQQGDPFAKKLLTEINVYTEQNTHASTQLPLQVIPPPVTVQPAPLATTNAPTVDLKVTPVTSMDSYYTVQLFSSIRQKDAVLFMEKWRNDFSPLIMRREIIGYRRIFVVVYGKYSSFVEAKQNISSLPLEIRWNKPFIVKTREEDLANCLRIAWRTAF